VDRGRSASAAHRTAEQCAHKTHRFRFLSSCFFQDGVLVTTEPSRDSRPHCSYTAGCLPYLFVPLSSVLLQRYIFSSYHLAQLSHHCDRASSFKRSGQRSVHDTTRHQPSKQLVLLIVVLLPATTYFSNGCAIIDST